jgi:hypothetical protein
MVILRLMHIMYIMQDVPPLRASLPPLATDLNWLDLVMMCQWLARKPFRRLHTEYHTFETRARGSLPEITCPQCPSPLCLGALFSTAALALHPTVVPGAFFFFCFLLLPAKSKRASIHHRCSLPAGRGTFPIAEDRERLDLQASCRYPRRLAKATLCLYRTGA